MMCDPPQADGSASVLDYKRRPHNPFQFVPLRPRNWGAIPELHSVLTGSLPQSAYPVGTVRELFVWGYCDRGMRLTIRLHPVPRYRMTYSGGLESKSRAEIYNSYLSSLSRTRAGIMPQITLRALPSTCLKTRYLIIIPLFDVIWPELLKTQLTVNQKQIGIHETCCTNEHRSAYK
jgi:hypothetical protein